MQNSFISHLDFELQPLDLSLDVREACTTNDSVNFMCDLGSEYEDIPIDNITFNPSGLLKLKVIGIPSKLTLIVHRISVIYWPNVSCWYTFLLDAFSAELFLDKLSTCGQKISATTCLNG